MSLLNLIKEVGVSVEDIAPVPVVTPAPMVAETVVSPVDAPSAAIPVADVVVSTEEPIVESVVAPVPADVVEQVAVVDELPPVGPDPLSEAQAAVLEAGMDVVEATAETILSEQAIIQEKVDELLEIQTSMESITQVIRRTGALGISNQVAEVVQIQMRAVNRRLGITSPFASMESFGAKDSREQHGTSRIALESIKTASKAALNKFVAFIERLIALAKKLVMNYYDGVSTMEKHAEELENRLGKLKVTEVKGSVQLPVNCVLIKDGKIDVKADPEVLGLTHFTCTAYPAAVVKYLDSLTKGVLKFDPEDGGEDIIDAMLDQYTKPLAFLLEQKLTEDTLPGNYKVEVGEEGLSFGMVRGEQDKSGDAADYPIPPVVDMRRLCREIRQLLAQVKDARSEVDVIGKASDKLIEAVKRVYERADAEAGSAYEALANKIGVVVSQANPRVGEIVGYVTLYVRSALGALTRMAAIAEQESAPRK